MIFKKLPFSLDFFVSSAKQGFRGLMRYSGEYNLLIFTFMLIYADHKMEERIRRDLKKVLKL